MALLRVNCWVLNFLICDSLLKTCCLCETSKRDYPWRALNIYRQSITWKRFCKMRKDIDTKICHLNHNTYTC